MLCAEALSFFLFLGTPFTFRCDLFAPQFFGDHPSVARRTLRRPILATQLLIHSPGFFQGRTQEGPIWIFVLPPVATTIADFCLVHVLFVVFRLVEDLPEVLRPLSFWDNESQILHLFDRSLGEKSWARFRSRRSPESSVSPPPLFGDKFL